MRRAIFLIILFIFLSLPSFALADTIISGSISTDTTWSPEGGVYIIESYFSVPAGVTLTIEPGTIIKGKATGMGGPSIYGKLIARGTESQPIYFTSFWNDEIGGDTDGTGPSVSSPGEWQGLYFKTGSEGILEYINLSFAGYGGDNYGNYVGIENDGGTLEIKNSEIIHNYKIVNDGGGGTMTVGSGIYNKSGSLQVINSNIEDNHIGIRIDGGSAIISGNTLKNNIDRTERRNDGYGLHSYNHDSLTVTDNIFSGNNRTAIVDASSEFVHSGNTSSDLMRRAFQIGGVLSQDITLSSGDLPYIIEYLVIPAGITLNIEPGVIIKMEDRYTNGSINVQGGNLIAKGTAENKIYITSLKDDSIGGDTNGDGELTTPAPRSWASIFLENGSNAEMDYVTLGYGGFNWNGEYLTGVAAAIYQRGANLSISNSLFKYNSGAAIYQDAGTTTISKSEFTGDYGLWSRGGAATISESSLVMTGYGVYNESGKDLGWWWETRPLQIIDARDNWWGSADGPNNTYAGTPTGSGTMITDNVLYTPFLTVWPPVVIEEPTINPVIIIPGIMGSAKKNGQWLIDPILHTYDDLIATLEANGYEKEKNLFTFPYEWRDSNILTANLLKNKIASVVQQCTSANLPDINCNKVDLVAHSMGGLVAREYVQSGQYHNNVDQLIFLGTPHKGSPKAYLQWEGGASDRDAASLFVNTYFTAEAARNGFGTVFEYIHNRPIVSVQQLLPIFSYIKDDNTGIDRQYSENYPRNIFIENLESNKNTLLNSTIRVIPTTKNGLWEHGQPENFYVPLLTDHGLERSVGDNTVTVFSSNLDDSIENINVDSDHNRLPTIAANQIFNILTDKVSGTNIDNGLNLDIKVLLLQLLSPIDVVITAPDGKRIGKNFATGEEYNEIAGAFYSGYNNADEEYITIPNPLDGEYKIEVQGTDSGGKYGVLTSYISDEAAITLETEGVTEPNQITSINTTVDNQNPDELKTEKIVTPETLLADIKKSYDLGWIKDVKTRDALLKQVNSAIKFSKKIEKVVERLPDGSKREKRIEKFSIKINKILVKIFEAELKVLLKKNKMTEDAYNLITNDVKYLINNN